MYLVVGLGNPGTKYEDTRHNAGFFFVDRMSEFLGWDSYYDVTDWEEVGKMYEIRYARAAGVEKVMFVKPLTFMNASGTAVRSIVRERKIKLADEFVLAHDDLDVPLGKYKIQTGVSPKEHNGVLSVERALSRRNFTRVRIGVDARGDDRSVPGEEYVLEKMTKEDLEKMDEAVADAVKQLRQSMEL